LAGVLLVVRHGETEPNVSGLFLGRADPPLTDLGRRQARALAVALPSPDLVISSPLGRAQETAAAFGQPVEVDERWIELDYGELDGTSPSAVPAEMRQRWLRDPSFAPPGGESLDLLAARVGAACNEVIDRAARSTIVVVTHVSPIKAALAWALDAPVEIAWRMYVEDAGVSRIDVAPDGPVVRWFNRGIPPVG
jgi:broad specificity phosphatase PhoE